MLILFLNARNLFENERKLCTREHAYNLFKHIHSSRLPFHLSSPLIPLYPSTLSPFTIRSDSSSFHPFLSLSPSFFFSTAFIDYLSAFSRPLFAVATCHSTYAAIDRCIHSMLLFNIHESIRTSDCRTRPC